MMSGNELQFGLIGLGVFAILALVVYNLWQERKARKLAEQAFRSTHHDVLLDGEVEIPVPPAPAGRMEPHLHIEESVSSQKTPDKPAAKPASRNPVHHRPQEPALSWEQQAIDCAVTIEAPAGVSASALFTAQQEVLAGVTRRMVWFGWSDLDRQWFEMDARTPGSLNRACVTLQLADRRGRIGDKELDRFYVQLQRVCDQFLAVPRLPPKADILARAQEIDRFSSDVDIQVAINLVAIDVPFSGPKIKTQAEASGLQLGNDGCYHALDEAGNAVFALANQESALFSIEQLKHLQTPGLTLVLDVPRTPNPVRAFDRMSAIALQLAEALGATLVDDNRTPLSERAIGLIRSQIGQYELQMERLSIPSGGEIASRLFA